MTIPYVSDMIEQYKLTRNRKRRKRIAILSLFGVGLLAFFAGSIIAGICLSRNGERRAARRAERLKAMRERVHNGLDLSDDAPATAFYDAEKGDFVKLEDNA